VYVYFVTDVADEFGGIEVIDFAANKSEGILVDDAELGGGLTWLRLALDGKGYVVTNSTTIASFDLSGYEVISKEVYKTSAYYLPDFAIDSQGRLLIAEQDFNNPGIVMLNPLMEQKQIR